MDVTVADKVAPSYLFVTSAAAAELMATRKNAKYNELLVIMLVPLVFETKASLTTAAWI